MDRHWDGVATVPVALYRHEFKLSKTFDISILLRGCDKPFSHARCVLRLTLVIFYQIICIYTCYSILTFPVILICVALYSST